MEGQEHDVQEQERLLEPLRRQPGHSVASLFPVAWRVLLGGTSGVQVWYAEVSWSICCRSPVHRPVGLLLSSPPEHNSLDQGVVPVPGAGVETVGVRVALVWVQEDYTHSGGVLVEHGLVEDGDDPVSMMVQWSVPSIYEGFGPGCFCGQQTGLC